MLFVTSRTTRQVDLTTLTVTLATSLFVIANAEEIAVYTNSSFDAFIEKARAEGHLQLPKVEGYSEKLDVSFTRKGFLIKLSITIPADAEPKSDQPVPGVLIIPNAPVRKPGKSWNEAQVKFEAFRLNYAPSLVVFANGTAEARVTDLVAAMEFLTKHGIVASVA